MYGATCRRAAGPRGGGGAYVVQWSTVDAFKQSHAAPGAFALLDDAGRALRAAALTFEPFWKPTNVSASFEGADVRRVVVRVSNQWGRNAQVAVSCEEYDSIDPSIAPGNSGLR